MTETWAIRGCSFQIRQVRQSDLNDVFAIYSDPEVMKFASDPCFTDIELAKHTIMSIRQNILEDAALELGVATLESKIVGTCSLQPARGPVAELGYLLHRDYWGRGIMLPALQSFLTIYVNLLDLSEIEATINSRNLRSIRLAEKLGLQRVDEQRWSCAASIFRTSEYDILDIYKEIVDG